MALLIRSFSSSTAAALSSISNKMATATATASEIQIQCSDGIQLAGQFWKATTAPTTATATATTTIPPAELSTFSPPERILCLHGWMDNCRSFHYLAPAIVKNRPNVELVALDFVGHGKSSHKSRDGPPMIMAETVYYVAETLQQLGWTFTTATATQAEHPNPQNTVLDHEQPPSPKVTLIGHSMGAAISCLYAAAFPEQVHKLVLIEGAGPLDRNPNEVARHVRSHVTRRLLGNQQSAVPKQPRIYATLELAVKTRCQTARNFPGNQWLSTEAATELVLRGTDVVELDQKKKKKEEDEASSSSSSSSMGFRFRHDIRLQWPSIQYMTPEQTNSLYQDIACPTALLLAQNGWPFDDARLQECIQLLRPAMFENRSLPGSHHCHADPESAEAVAQKVLEFLGT